MNIQWYPGHMTKTKRQILEDLKLVDIAVEILDARIPLSSRNPDMKQILNDKKEIIILNKTDMADPKMTKEWISFLKEQGEERVLDIFELNSLKQNEFKKIVLKIKELGLAESKRYKKYGDKTVRAMILGVPNTGKSTFINTFNQKKKTVTGDKPGVTRGRQWVKTPFDVDLLDTPGVLWPKFKEERVGLMLAFTGAIKGDILDKETLALRLIEYMTPEYHSLLEDRYKIQIDGDMTALMIYEAIGKKRGFLIRNGEIDYDRTANIILSEFRTGKMGPITLETPDDFVYDEGGYLD